MYRFLLRPRWVISHVLVVSLVITMVGAAGWQWNRYNEEKAAQGRLDARLAAEPVALDEVVDADDGYAAGEDLADIRVVVEGTYLSDAEVTIRNRSLDGVPGSWVLTPLLTDNGAAVVVNRGWTNKTAVDVTSATAAPGTADAGEADAGEADAGEADADIAAPDGRVEVVGLVQPTSIRRGFFSPTDPEEGVLTDMARPDLARIQQQIDVDIYPVLVQLQDQQPSQPNSGPLAVPVEEPTPGQNLGYAGQWLIFTIIAIMGYPLILRRVAHSRPPSEPEISGEDRLDDEPEPSSA